MEYPLLLELSAVSRFFSHCLNLLRLIKMCLFNLEFVAMPLGQGYTVEGQITGKEVSVMSEFRLRICGLVCLRRLLVECR